jgi:hypothetical protein
MVSLDKSTKQTVCLSAVRTALDPSNPSIRAEATLADCNSSSDVGEIHKTILYISDLTGHAKISTQFTYVIS